MKNGLCFNSIKRNYLTINIIMKSLVPINKLIACIMISVTIISLFTQKEGEQKKKEKERDKEF
jgi:hypothetical protein